jgi:protease PrsW
MNDSSEPALDRTAADGITPLASGGVSPDPAAFHAAVAEATAGTPRPWVRATFLTSGRAVTVLGIFAVLALLLGAADEDPGVFATACLVAALPLPIYLGLALWIDRFEPEPRAMLATAFLWGASVAVFVAGLLNAAMDAVAGNAFGSIVSGPIVEEGIKAVILFRFFSKRPDEFDGIVDGLIYAAMVGLGFACVENIEYYARALARDGVGSLALTFTARALIGPFSHPLFTGMTGLGLGVARQTTSPLVRRAAPVAGLLAAITLHSLWNAGTSLGCVFLIIYGLIMIPALLALLGVALVALKGEGRILRVQLAPEVAAGILARDEFERLCSVRGRLDASYRAWSQGGRHGLRRRRAFHRAASELAFLRHRVAQGRQPADPVLEEGYLKAVAGSQ